MKQMERAQQAISLQVPNLFYGAIWRWCQQGSFAELLSESFLVVCIYLREPTSLSSYVIIRIRDSSDANSKWL